MDAANNHRTAVLSAALAGLESRRFDIAAELSARLIRDDPDDIQGLLICGLAAGVTGHTRASAALLHRAAANRGTERHPIHDLAGLLRETGQADRIEDQYRAAILLNPADPELLRGLGELLFDSARAAEAIEPLRQAAALEPSAATRNLLALAQAAHGDTDDAIDLFRRLLCDDPGNATVWANLGLLLKDDGRFAEALEAYDRAVALAPADAQIRVNRVVARLGAGQWAEAWPDYEWRLTLAGHAARRPNLLPCLSTLPDLSGKTILAVHEDGFGDTLHFARYLPLLAERGARVVAAVPPALTEIMRTVPDVSNVHGMDELVPYDFYCPFFSLPRAFETTPSTIPAPIPYLRADPKAVAMWRDRLPAAALRAGLVWAGQARPGLPGFAVLDRRRSLPLAALAPLAALPGIAFVALQHGKERAQRPPEGMTLFDPMEEAATFADTAAIVANLDVVVTVDTAMAHLAGGMGKPVFLLDRYDHCWRWPAGQNTTAWYPSMRIFRQNAIGAWEPVIAGAAEALARRDIPMT